MLPRETEQHKYIYMRFKRAKLIHEPDLLRIGVIKRRRDLSKGEAPQSALTSENWFQNIHRHEMFDLGNVQALVLSKQVSRHIDILRTCCKTTKRLWLHHIMRNIATRAINQL